MASDSPGFSDSAATKTVSADAYQDFLRRSREVVCYWCRFVDAEIRFQGEAINQDFTLASPCQLRHREEGTEVVVGYPEDLEPRFGFYNRGLTLLEGRSAAGAPYAGTVPLGHAVRVLTGALLPEGVDTVVMQEHVTPGAGTINFAAGVAPGANTRAKHIPGLQALLGVEIVGVCNRSRASSERVAKEFGIPKTYDLWTEVVEDPGTTAIVIGTWPHMHARAVLAARTRIRSNREVPALPSGRGATR